MLQSSKFFGLVFVATLSACTHGSTTVVSSESDAILTPTKLIASANTRVGEKVTLVGYFTWRTDTRALWEDKNSQSAAQNGTSGSGTDYWAKCVTVYPPGAKAQKLSDQNVRVTGTVAIIEKDDMRSFWTCNKVALENAEITAEK